MPGNEGEGAALLDVHLEPVRHVFLRKLCTGTPVLKFLLIER
jgi:hypothetical protein